ncbi:TPA: hypothetical protein ACQNX0_001407 [Streptococcus pyogenes]
MTQVAQGRSKGKSLLCHQCNALFVFIIFLILLAVLFGVRYRNSSIEGIWRTTSIDQKLGDDFAKRLTGLHQSPLIDDSLLTSSQMILTVKNNNVDLSSKERQIIENSMPASHELEMILDQAFEKLASQIGGKYNQKTGHLSAVVLKGKVNRILHTIDIKEEVAAGHTSFSKGLLTPNGYFDYTRFGKKLELLGDEKIIFKKALKKKSVKCIT